MGAKRPPPPRRRQGWSPAGWWLTIAVATAALLQAASADVSISTTADNEEKKRSLGEPCEDLRECSAPNSFCQPGRDVCACLPEFPHSDGKNQCGKAVPWNEECVFSEQCTAKTEKTVCKNGRCSCKFQMIAKNQTDGSVRCEGGELKYGDRCESASQCGFDHGVCEKTGGKQTCQCQPEFSVTNHLDMCGKPVKINESCEFTEQCEKTTEKTECRDGRCVCRFQMSILYKTDGTVECVDVKQEPASQQYIDPAMIGVLAGMALMFIILCVVLHLFSKARWRENRTIFNTPNPRLMNVSLLRDSKLIHGGTVPGGRRSSRASAKSCSRQSSVGSLGDGTAGRRRSSRHHSRTSLGHASSSASLASDRRLKSSSGSGGGGDDIEADDTLTRSHTVSELRA